MGVFQVGEIVSNRWTIEYLLAEGGFGSVYVAVGKDHIERVAVKAESAAARRPVLKMELGVLVHLAGQEHFCQLLDRGRLANRGTFIVMTLLGRNLYDLRCRRPQRVLQSDTVARVAIQCVNAIWSLHEAGYVHRDIKPANFAIGLGTTGRIVHLIDFGLCRMYKDQRTGAITPPRPEVGFRGTVRYASVSAHLNRELGRRDDLMSLMYLLVESKTGSLPWKEYETRDVPSVARLKRTISAEKLTEGMESPAYAEIFRHLLRLRYADQPDYLMCVNRLQQVQTNNTDADNGPFEWEEQ